MISAGTVMMGIGILGTLTCLVLLIVLPRIFKKQRKTLLTRVEHEYRQPRKAVRGNQTPGWDQSQGRNQTPGWNQSQGRNQNTGWDQNQGRSQNPGWDQSQGRNQSSRWDQNSGRNQNR